MNKHISFFASPVLMLVTGLAKNRR